ncbi:sensor histidine kinase [Sphingomonas changnyeongensis]|uniref:histidine kinase n=1 Tax=Sphingomonas changnyeongensis TaxID=2698679 RepID=A0A7Z2S5L5_9SPHN|nr:histidine kinase dimerization/phospho-acceptor domain-containing protein [Sphingomonas changnyeongensis]QHL91260.1 sensor histidine kinase [Sphingomonas changnyeongensis]
MRFDDRLATVLGLPASGRTERLALWRQLVDLLAQADRTSSPRRDEALARLRDWRGEVPDAARRGAALALAGEAVPADLVHFFAEDEASIAAPVLARAAMDDEAWAVMIPRLSPIARALLRHRRDLGPKARHALDAFGPSDLMIGAGPVPANDAAGSSEDMGIDVEAGGAGETDALPDDHAQADPETVPGSPAGQTEAMAGRASPPIAELVARIAAFREGRADTAFAAPPPARVREFLFETGPDGVIHWCDLDARGAVIGLSIASADETSAHGVDGHAAGAFRRRASFRDARLTLAGEGAIGGEWRISAVPVFDPAIGRFSGYRGSARRPRLDERAELPGLFGTSLPGEALRQLAHEIRTPLNAIIGFAELIEQQIMGPVNVRYRQLAAEILGEGRALLATIDDLETAARIEARALRLAPRPLDLGALLASLGPALSDLADLRGVAFALRLAPDLPTITADPVSTERMLVRLLGAMVGLAGAGETVEARLDPGIIGQIRLSVSRPAVLAGRDERSLLDPAHGPDGDWPDAPVLGLGFTLRLVRGLAEAAGGRLVIEAERIALTLPAVAGAAAAAELEQR